MFSVRATILGHAPAGVGVMGMDQMWIFDLVIVKEKWGDWVWSRRSIRIEQRSRSGHSSGSHRIHDAARSSLSLTHRHRLDFSFESCNLGPLKADLRSQERAARLCSAAGICCSMASTSFSFSHLLLDSDNSLADCAGQLTCYRHMPDLARDTGAD